MKKKRVPTQIILILIFIFLTIQISVFAEEQNLTLEQQAIICLRDSRELMEELYLNNFSTARINDTIKEAESLLIVQQILKERGRPQDYNSILLSCDKIQEIRDTAFDLRDQIRVLKEFHNTFSENIQTAEIDRLFQEINKEMNNERYELVSGIIKNAYDEITLAKSRDTTLNVFYDATTRGLRRFFYENWIKFLVGLVVIFILFLLVRIPIERKIMKLKLENLELRKKSLKEMITKNQDSYFNKGKISEESFSIKNKKIAELIRDVDRQISLIRENLLRIDKKISPQTNKKN